MKRRVRDRNEMVLTDHRMVRDWLWKRYSNGMKFNSFASLKLVT